MEDRLLYRVTEVAVFLNVSRSKVYELLASGDLRSVKIDRTRLVRGSDLRDYVEPEVRQEVGHLKRVHHVGLARVPHLALVLEGGEDVRAPQQLEVGLRAVRTDFLDDVFEANHAGWCLRP